MKIELSLNWIFKIVHKNRIIFWYIYANNEKIFMEISDNDINTNQNNVFKIPFDSNESNNNSEDSNSNN